MSVTDIRIPRSTLAELRGVLVRALSRENLSFNDKIAIRKSHSSNALKSHYVGNYDDYQSFNGGKADEWVDVLLNLGNLLKKRAFLGEMKHFFFFTKIKVF